MHRLGTKRYAGMSAFTDVAGPAILMLFALFLISLEFTTNVYLWHFIPSFLDSHKCFNLRLLNVSNSSIYVIR